MIIILKTSNNNSNNSNNCSNNKNSSSHNNRVRSSMSGVIRMLRSDCLPASASEGARTLGVFFVQCHALHNKALRAPGGLAHDSCNISGLIMAHDSCISGIRYLWRMIVVYLGGARTLGV